MKLLRKYKDIKFYTEYLEIYQQHLLHYAIYDYHIEYFDFSSI